jgi:hypothetical protein
MEVTNLEISEWNVSDSRFPNHKSRENIMQVKGVKSILYGSILHGKI